MNVMTSAKGITNQIPESPIILGNIKMPTITRIRLLNTEIKADFFASSIAVKNAEIIILKPLNKKDKLNMRIAYPLKVNKS